MSRLEQEMRTLAQQAGGSHKTVHDRMALAQRFCARLIHEQNVQIRRVDQLKARHIEGYIQNRLAQSINKRSLQNEMSALRQILIRAGRDKLAHSARLSNVALGLAGASRHGTHLAITPERYQNALAAAQQKDAGLAAAMALARMMGLRSEEAVQCGQSLNTWQKALAKGAASLRIVFGTKGGRPRDTHVLDAGAVKKAVDNALAVAEDRNGRLIDKPDLKSAMKYWHSQAGRMGLKGEYSPHSLRYAWAQDALACYLVQGYSEKEALAQTAMDLGHGDGRGRWVAQIYGRKEEAG
ncbi:integrase domain-containing protein [Buttiauxella selenatireducens]|uniref:Integrase domain-containing protein n=1 Tax=Buttiauxella selenatireducens TaxID=3073902 RepID=A0ABY9SEL7_9ENTR|nr:integrase domain-containing protein [Buttiauxella sp. R73]WMY75946.1 integrase domain-containing protein [Buttiauxella sp. R73]